MTSSVHGSAKLSTALLAALALVAPAGAASITPGNLPQFGDENVLFNGAGLTPTGTTVQGRTNQSDLVVDFSSTSVLTTPARGQARLDAAAGTFADFSVRLDDPAATFRSLILDLGAARDGTADVTVYGPSDAVLSQTTVPLGRNGNNFYTILAGAHESISHVLISRSATLDDVKQFRIGGVTYAPVVPPPDPPTFPHLPEGAPSFTPAVPTPAAAWGGLALLGLGAAARRVRSAGTAPG